MKDKATILDVASAFCLQGKNNRVVLYVDMVAVASACCLQGKNNWKYLFARIIGLHLPAVCKVKTTNYSCPR